MKKVIVSIFVFCLFGFYAFAENSQNGSIINNTLQDLGSSVVPVRNDAGDSGIVNTDISLSELETGTSETLAKTVDEILKNSSNFSSFDWCRDASSFVGDLPLNAKQSLAWNKNSFQSVIDYVPDDVNVADSYKNIKIRYDDFNSSLEDMTSVLIVDQAAGRFVAIARSSAIEILREFKSVNKNKDRLNGLGELAKKSIECASPEKSDVSISKLGAILGSDFDNNSFNNEQDSKYINTKIDRSNIKEDTVVISQDSVDNLKSFEDFILGQMTLNKNIISVEDNESSLVLKYKVASKLFGLFKSSTNAKITINDDLSVKVGYSFGGILSSKNLKINNKDLSAALKIDYSIPEGERFSALKMNFKAKAQTITKALNYFIDLEQVNVMPVDMNQTEDKIQDIEISDSSVLGEEVIN